MVPRKASHITIPRIKKHMGRMPALTVMQYKDTKNFVILDGHHKYYQNPERKTFPIKVVGFRTRQVMADSWGETVGVVKWRNR